MKYFVLALLICLPLFAWAQSNDSFVDPGRSGSDYLRKCPPSRHAPSSQNNLECAVWMSSLLYAFQAYEATSKVRLFDQPEDLTAGQMAKIAVKFMNENPEQLNRRTAELVLFSPMESDPGEKPGK